MSVVTYDPDFDKKVDQGAAALLEHRKTPPEQWAEALNAARAEARIVLLVAMAIQANK